MPPEPPKSLVEKPLLRALDGHVAARPPIWLMRQAGRYLPEYRAIRSRVRGFLDLCYTPDLAVEVTLQPIRRFGLDAAILFSDILVVPHALGAEVGFVEGEGPRLEPIRTAAAVEKLGTARFDERLAPVHAALRGILPELPADVALIGFAGAPWTLAAYMVEGRGSKDFLEPRAMARREPALFQTLIDKLTAAVVRFLRTQAEAGAEVVQLFDSWAGVLPPAEFRRWCIETAREIVAALRASHPRLKVICFPRGAGAGYGEFAARVRPHGLGLDTTVDPAWAAARLTADGACLQGNLDPVALLAGGDAMLAEADGILAAMAGRPLIFNLGHGVLPPTDPDEVGRLVDHLRSVDGPS
jgi:uroporphyrinogen decarboxylase